MKNREKFFKGGFYWPVIILLISSAVVLVPLTYSAFVDKVTVGGWQLSTGDWINPESEITEIAAGQPVKGITKDCSFEITYQAEDVGSGIDYIELWYSFNQNNWQYLTKNGSSNRIDFSCPDGDGFYDFQTLAVDNRGNKENKNFEADLKTIFIDTSPPTTTLNISGSQIELLAEDGFGSGVVKIHYAINGQPINSVYGSKVDLTSQLQTGENSINYFSEDTVGNIESEKISSYFFE